MIAGTHISSDRTFYTHHGIYIGNGRVIHYSGMAAGISKGQIEETSLEAFSGGSKKITKIRHLDRKYQYADIVERAHSKIGEDDYNLVFNNCEHFATWCVTGKHESAQVETVKTVIELSSVTYKAYKTYASWQEASSIISAGNMALTGVGKSAITSSLTSPALQGFVSTISGASLTSASVSGLTSASVSGLTSVVGIAGGTAIAPVLAVAGGAALVGYGLYKLCEFFDD